MSCLFEVDCDHCGHLIQRILPGDAGNQNREGIFVYCADCGESNWLLPEGADRYQSQECPWFVPRSEQGDRTLIDMTPMREPVVTDGGEVLAESAPQRPCKYCGKHVKNVDDPDPDFGDPVWVHWGCLP